MYAPTAVATPTRRFLRLPEVASSVGVSRSTILRWEASGDFPRRRRLGRNVVAWSVEDLDAWSAQREVVGGDASEEAA